MPAEGIDCTMAHLLSGNISHGSLHPDFERLTVPLRHRFVRLMGLLGDGVTVSKPGQQAGLHRLGVARRFVVGAVRLLQAWPTQFEERLIAVRQTADMSPSLKGTYGVFYRVLYADLRDPEFQFARDAYEDHLRRHWWGLVCRRNGLLRPRTVEHHPRQTLQRAAEAAKARPAVVRHLVQAHLVHVDAVTLASGRRMTTMHEDEVAPLAALVDGAMTLAEAARHAALPECRLRQLIKAGLVRPLVSRSTQRAATWLIAKADLERLHVKVVGSCEEPSITIRDALKYWQLQESEAMAMLVAVLDSKLPAHADDERSMPVGLSCVIRHELKDWLLAFRSTSRISMSIDQASALLGVKQQVAYDLVRKGLLKTSGGYINGKQVLSSDLAVFERDFVSLVSLAKAVERSPKAVLDELPIRPVTGPCIDGTRQYFYRRDEIMAHQALLEPDASKEGLR